MPKQSNNQVNEIRFAAQKEFNKEMKDSLKEILKEVKDGNQETHDVKRKVEKLEIAVEAIQKKQNEDKELNKNFNNIYSWWKVTLAILAFIAVIATILKNTGVIK